MNFEIYQNDKRKREKNDGYQMIILWQKKKTTKANKQIKFLCINSIRITKLSTQKFRSINMMLEQNMTQN